MENHPIPQDVTGFKFKLIGSITVKQFSYLLLASITCYIIFLLPGYFLLKVPFIALFAFLGFGLAFLPIDGRPMDIMLLYFLRAIPADNQYVYKKTGVETHLDSIINIHVPTHGVQKTQIADLPQKEPTAYPIPEQALRKSPTMPLEEHEKSFIKSIFSIFETAHAPTSTTQIVPNPAVPQSTSNTTTTVSEPIIVSDLTILPTPQQKKEGEEKEKKQKKIAAAPPPQIKKAETPKAQPSAPTPPSAPEKQQISNEELAQGQYLEQAKQQQENQQIQSVPADSTSRVQRLDQQQSAQAGFPLIPDVPNVILGVVKDPRGKILPNVLVEIYDKNNIPVRAFKTNQLGQFASATQLPNGDYVIHLDDPMKKNEFDTVSVNLNGTIFFPIEIRSIDDREKLRQELFS